MLSLVRPRYFVPVHGEYRHLVAARARGPRRRRSRSATEILISRTATSCDSTARAPRSPASAPVGRVLIDGTRTGEVGDEVLRDRSISRATAWSCRSRRQHADRRARRHARDHHARLRRRRGVRSACCATPTAMIRDAVRDAPSRNEPTWALRETRAVRPAARSAAQGGAAPAHRARGDGDLMSASVVSRRASEVARRGAVLRRPAVVRRAGELHGPAIPAWFFYAPARRSRRPTSPGRSAPSSPSRLPVARLRVVPDSGRR